MRLLGALDLGALTVCDMSPAASETEGEQARIVAAWSWYYVCMYDVTNRGREEMRAGLQSLLGV